GGDRGQAVTLHHHQVDAASELPGAQIGKLLGTVFSIRRPGTATKRFVGSYRVSREEPARFGPRHRHRRMRVHDGPNVRAYAIGSEMERQFARGPLARIARPAVGVHEDEILASKVAQAS